MSEIIVKMDDIDRQRLASVYLQTLGIQVTNRSDGSIITEDPKALKYMTNIRRAVWANDIARRVLS